MEVILNGNATCVAIDDNISLSLIVGRLVDGRFYISLGGMDIATNMSYTWIQNDNLSLHDRITISVKELGQPDRPVDEHLFIPESCRHNDDTVITAEQQEELNRNRLRRFRNIESILLKEGLIKP